TTLPPRDWVCLQASTSKPTCVKHPVRSELTTTNRLASLARFSNCGQVLASPFRPFEAASFMELPLAWRKLRTIHPDCQRSSPASDAQSRILRYDFDADDLAQDFLDTAIATIG